MTTRDIVHGLRGVERLAGSPADDVTEAVGHNSFPSVVRLSRSTLAVSRVGYSYRVDVQESEQHLSALIIVLNYGEVVPLV